jgi:hypothetical protein
VALTKLVVNARGCGYAGNAHSEVHKTDQIGTIALVIAEGKIRVHLSELTFGRCRLEDAEVKVHYITTSAYYAIFIVSTGPALTEIKSMRLHIVL